jgi:endonuclease/exonuclease/phosphatase family metal-dependent hydrolase
MRTCIAIAALGVLAAGCRSLPEPDFSPAEPNLKVITYNVNWGFAQPQNVVEFLSKGDADIICLQETHDRWEAVLRTHLATTYPYSIFEDWTGAAGGIAVMSRYALRNVRLLAAPAAGWFPAIRAEVETPIGPIQLLNVHLKPPVSEEGLVTASAYYTAPSVHLDELRVFLSTVDTHRPLIIAGDFNENEKAKAIKWLLDQGYQDALSIYDRRTKTWIWPTPLGIKLKNRFDHIIVNSRLMCTGARVINVEASDHMPVMAVIVSGQTE